MSGLHSMILQALERSKEAKDLIWRAVRTGCQENRIHQTLITASGWAQPGSVTRTCAWPSTATCASTSQQVGSASLLLSADIPGSQVSWWHVPEKNRAACRGLSRPLPLYQVARQQPHSLCKEFGPLQSAIYRHKERGEALMWSFGTSFSPLFEQSVLLPPLRLWHCCLDLFLCHLVV